MKNALVYLALAFTIGAYAQKTFTRKDSLHGGLRPERLSYDVQRYDLNLRIDPDKRTIAGYNDITFKLSAGTPRIQVDLFENMSIDSIVFQKSRLKYRREYNAVFIDLPSLPASEYAIRFYYSGMPRPAKQAPWDGGFDWKKDAGGKHWVGVAVQGTGASLWYPCKDSQTDEPDRGATIKIAVPDGLMNVSNGRFKGSEKVGGGFTRWDWELKSPINNYDITVNIADYAHIHENYKGLDLDYYVLRYNEERARKHFEEVKPMMDCFQSKFGEYPFKEDGFKLVETPYLGMEHQSAVAYGNRYLKGYLGNDISGSGVGLLFDYIIIHESGHEWFGNSVTSKDIADMWIHEGFTTYTETVFVECVYGYEKAMMFINGEKNNISNDRPIIGNFGVNDEGSGDMYYKGALLLNTLRHIVADDAKWWAMLKKYAETYRHSIIDTQTVEDFFSRESTINLRPMFQQYLTTTNIPEFLYRVDGGKISYKWNNVVPGFAMPVDVLINGQTVRLHPEATIKETKIERPKGGIKVKTDQFLIRYGDL